MPNKEKETSMKYCEITELLHVLSNALSSARTVELFHAVASDRHEADSRRFGCRYFWYTNLLL